MKRNVFFTCGGMDKAFLNRARSFTLLTILGGFCNPLLKYAITWVVDELNINTLTFVVANRLLHDNLARPSTNMTGWVG
jgi:hypothetical protein